MEFREALIAACEALVQHAEYCKNEESTKQFLILPFIRFLGYDILNPSEVLPEQSADFSDRHKNRADYVLQQDGKPVVAIEAKVTGANLRRDVGQLRGYFNALRTIKVGIITDGLVYECYSDTIDPNIMDDRPFLSFSLKDIAERKIDAAALDGIGSLKKESFDSTQIVEKARENLLSGKVARLLSEWFESPPPDLVRLLLDHAGFEGKMTRRVLEEHTPIISQGLKAFFDKKMLERIGYADREVVKLEASDEPDSEPESDDEPNWAIPTEAERRVYEYATSRLAFLSDSEAMFREIERVKYSALKHTFIVYYKRRNKGKLFNFRMLSSGEMEFQFPQIDEAGVTGEIIVTQRLAEMDDHLLKTFKLRAFGASDDSGVDGERTQTSTGVTPDSVNVGHSSQE